MWKENLSVPKGVVDGMVCRVKGKGNRVQAKGKGAFNIFTGASNDKQKTAEGDLIFKLHVRDHHYFKREGCHIHTDKFVSAT